MCSVVDEKIKLFTKKRQIKIKSENKNKHILSIN